MEKRTGTNGPAAEEREQALAREIRVKDALIHEVHHRVKNNLQTVESLMRLHIRRCPSEEARSVLVEAAGRLRSMAIAHEMLSEATKEQVDAIELARRVSQQVKTSMCGDSSRFCITVTGAPRLIPGSVSISLALVIAEITCNSFEHGFAEETQGNVNISLKQTEKGLRVTIGDDGCGLPSGFTVQGQTSMGLTLMRTLVEDDLRSELEEVATPIGTCFTSAASDVASLVKRLFEFARDFEGEIPGAKPEECGNYHDSDIAQAQWWAKRYVTKTLSCLDEAHTHYPALLN